MWVLRVPLVRALADRGRDDADHSLRLLQAAMKVPLHGAGCIDRVAMSTDRLRSTDTHVRRWPVVAYPRPATSDRTASHTSRVASFFHADAGFAGDRSVADGHRPIAIGASLTRAIHGCARIAGTPGLGRDTADSDENDRQRPAEGLGGRSGVSGYDLLWLLTTRSIATSPMAAALQQLVEGVVN